MTKKNKKPYSVGKKLQRLRAEHKLSLVDVEGLTGFPPSYISAVENEHKCNLTMTTLERFACLYGVSVSFLLEGN